MHLCVNMYLQFRTTMFYVGIMRPMMTLMMRSMSSRYEIALWVGTITAGIVLSGCQRCFTSMTASTWRRHATLIA